jgi:hypothetical protein
VAAVIQNRIVLVEPDFARSAKLEEQQRLWPGRGGQQRSRRKWSEGDTSITVFEVGTKQPVLTGLKKKLRPLALGCLVPMASYPDLCVFGQLRSTRPTPDEKTYI